MRKKLNIEKCKECIDGSCCQDGVELSKQEIRHIIDFAPAVKKPWFRRVASEYNPAPGYPFETIIKDNRCIFQDENKRCLVYPARPKHCREFPFENDDIAEYYDSLCGKIHE